MKISDGTNRITNIPSLFISSKDGNMIKNSIENNHMDYALINIPLNLTYIDENKLKRAPWSMW